MNGKKEQRKSAQKRMSYLGLWLFVGVLCSNCSVPLLQTRSYTWKNDTRALKPKKKITKNWYVLSTDPKKAVMEKEKLGWCGERKLLAVHNQLNHLTHQCVKVSSKFFRAAVSDRALYYSALSLGILGGTAVLVAPVASLVAEKTPTNQSTSLALTVAGAAAISVSSLWIRSLGVGKSSNVSFQKSTKLAKLIQSAEVAWLASVCKAPSLKIAMENASNILKQMAKQCVPKIPNVQINPDISNIVRKEQKSTQAIITRYQMLQNSMNAQKEVDKSNQLLEKYNKELEATYARLLSGSSPKYSQHLVALEVMCQKIKAEHNRNHQLQVQIAQRSGGSKLPPGGWSGICSKVSLKKLKRLSARKEFESQLTKSQTKFKQLIPQIVTLHQKSTKLTIARPSTNKLKGLCLQTEQVYKRIKVLKSELNDNAVKRALPPGVWYGICKTHFPKIFSTRISQP